MNLSDEGSPASVLKSPLSGGYSATANLAPIFFKDKSLARTTQRTQILYSGKVVFTAMLNSNRQGVDHIENT
jgi:hypothetical protein